MELANNNKETAPTVDKNNVVSKISPLMKIEKGAPIFSVMHTVGQYGCK